MEPPLLLVIRLVIAHGLPPEYGAYFLEEGGCGASRLQLRGRGRRRNVVGAGGGGGGGERLERADGHSDSLCIIVVLCVRPEFCPFVFSLRQQRSAVCWRWWAILILLLLLRVSWGAVVVVVVVAEWGSGGEVEREAERLDWGGEARRGERPDDGLVVCRGREGGREMSSRSVGTSS